MKETIIQSAHIAVSKVSFSDSVQITNSPNTQSAWAKEIKCVTPKFSSV